MFIENLLASEYIARTLCCKLSPQLKIWSGIQCSGHGDSATYNEHSRRLAGVGSFLHGFPCPTM